MKSGGDFLMHVRKATEMDMNQITFLVGQAGLSNEGIMNGEFYLLEDETIQGVIGMERVEKEVLFRSFIFSKEVDTWNIYHFFESIIESIKQQGVEKLYLVTNSDTSLPFFQLFGFKQGESSRVSSKMKELSHFQQAISQQNACVLYTTLSTC